MINKIKEALITRWSNQLGIKDEKVFEGVAISVEPFITSDEQLTQFVEGAKSMLTQPQSYADKVRTELNAKLKEAESAKAELEAKLNGNHPNPEPKPQPEQPDIAAIVAQAVTAAVAPLQEKLNAFETTRAKETAVAALDKFCNEWDYAGGFPKERDEAKRIALKVYKAGGEQMTGEQLIAAFREEFDSAVKSKGVTDFSKPFQSDGGAGGDDADFSAFDKAAEKLGWVEPK
ncbi:hypothetical protein [uncultured Bacteroides sp.]|uniref:hypothetical protein n=1 Tax=uncultured Bacteroides sp. TaxID=162156 RepID=UPI00263156E8|nr:hypothetical protein [uncultured Bacteroides sp.]